MLRKVFIGLAIVVFLIEISCKLTDYTYTFFAFKFLARTYLVVFFTVLIIVALREIPKQVIIALSIVLLISLVILLSLVAVPVIMGFSGHSERHHSWTEKQYRIEKETGQGWAGPKYDNYILFRTNIFGLFKTEIDVTAAATQSDSCIIEFITDGLYNYRFNRCKKEFKIIKEP